MKMMQAFAHDGKPVTGPDWREDFPPEFLARRQAELEAQLGQPVAIYVGDAASTPDGALVAEVVNGQVRSVALDLAWQPPAPPTPEPALLAELLAKVDRLPSGTIHETRLKDQKEFMKLWAIPWVKAHPEATPVDAALAILAALRAEFRTDPIVIQVYDKDPLTGREDGLLMSYADSAHTAGLTPELSWLALRELIVNTPEQMLRDALRKL
jgi:hypothetical protein